MGIKIYFDNNNLHLNIEQDTKFPISTLKILGFSIRSNNNIFYYENKSKTESVLIDLIEFLEKKNIPYTLDNDAKNKIELAKELQQKKIDLKDPKKYEEMINSVEVKYSKKWKRVLTPLQEEAVIQAITSTHAANFSVPGAGKTSIALAYYDYLKQHTDIKNIIVVAPSRLAFMSWMEQWCECFDEVPNENVILKSNRSWENDYESSDINLLTYNTLLNVSDDLERVLEQHPSLLILDESHRIKKYSVKNSEDDGKQRYHAIKIAPYARIRMILSGTPMPWAEIDLWGQFRFLLCNQREFFSAREFGNRGFDEIKNMIKPYTSRINKKQLNLPEQQFERLEVTLKPHQQEIYTFIWTRFRELIEKDEIYHDRVLLEHIMSNYWLRLRQCAVNPALLTMSLEMSDGRGGVDSVGSDITNLIRNYSNTGEVPAKLEYAEKITREFVNNNKKVILWNSFKGGVKYLTERFSDIECVAVTGEEDDDKDNQQKLHQFKTKDSTKILITTPNSCGESISLHNVCSKSIYVDRSFDATHYMQSLDRIHRFGMKDDIQVQYIILLAKDTIDMTINSKLYDRHQKMKKMLSDPDIGIYDKPEDIYSWFLKFSNLQSEDDV